MPQYAFDETTRGISVSLKTAAPVPVLVEVLCQLLTSTGTVALGATSQNVTVATGDMPTVVSFPFSDLTSLTPGTLYTPRIMVYDKLSGAKLVEATGKNVSTYVRGVAIVSITWY